MGTPRPSDGNSLWIASIASSLTSPNAVVSATHHTNQMSRDIEDRSPEREARLRKTSPIANHRRAALCSKRHRRMRPLSPLSRAERGRCDRARLPGRRHDLPNETIGDHVTADVIDGPGRVR